MSAEHGKMAFASARRILSSDFQNEGPLVTAACERGAVKLTTNHFGCTFAPVFSLLCDWRCDSR